MTPMPARDVEAEHRPDQPELRGLVRVAQMHVVLGDHGVRRGPAGSSLRAASRRRQAIAERADHHEHEIDRGHGQEGLPDADVGRRLEIVHQQVGERRADHRAAAEAHDRHAGRHAAAVRKPFDQRRHRRDVAEPEPDAADHAGAEPHQPELMGVDADRAEHQAAAPAQRRDDAGLARAGAFEPAAPERRRGAEQHEEQRVHPAQLATRQSQVVVNSSCASVMSAQAFGCRQPDRARQRQPEHAEAVGHADAQMDAERRRRHQPAIEARLWR